MKKAPENRPIKLSFNKFVKYGKISFVVGVAGELSFLAGSFLIYRRLNRDQEYRYSCSKGKPWTYMLNVYYKTGEWLGNLNTREEDQKAFVLLDAKHKISNE